MIYRMLDDADLDPAGVGFYPLNAIAFIESYPA